jgi:hypothetical protein
MSDMIKIPSQFPSYSSSNQKVLLMHVDILKHAVTQLQEMVVEQAVKTTQPPVVTKPARPVAGNTSV